MSNTTTRQPKEVIFGTWVSNAALLGIEVEVIKNRNRRLCCILAFSSYDFVGAIRTNLGLVTNLNHLTRMQNNQLTGFVPR